jgi:hypothetical protein
MPWLDQYLTTTVVKHSSQIWAGKRLGSQGPWHSERARHRIELFKCTPDRSNIHQTGQIILAEQVKSCKAGQIESDLIEAIEPRQSEHPSHQAGKISAATSHLIQVVKSHHLVKVVKSRRGVKSETS